MVKESISKNIEKGALQSNYSQKFPNLESGLSLYYAASLEGKHELANKAYATAYKEKVPDKQTSDLQKVSAPVYPSGSNTPTPFSRSSNQQTPLYNPSPSFQPNLSNYYAPLSQNKYPRFKDMTEEDITLYAESLFKNGENDKNRPDLNNYFQNVSNTSSNAPIKDPLKDVPKETENKDKEKNNLITGIGTALDAMSLIPGIDTITNILSIPFDIYEGDYWGALLSAIGALPLVGEIADTAKVAKTGVKIADKVHDASKITKIADNIIDLSKNEKFLEQAGELGQCFVDGVITGNTYASDGKSFGKGFANGFVASFISNQIKLPIKNDILKESISGSIGSTLVTVVEGVFNGDNIEQIAKESAKSAAIGFLATASTSLVKDAIKVITNAKSSVRIITEYDKTLGKALELYFTSIITILSSKEY